MKIKYFKIIMCSILILIFLNSISFMCVADEGDIVITNIESQYKKVEKYGKDTWEFYKFIVYVENKGTTESYNITVELQDEDGNYTRNYLFSNPDDYYILSPGESASYVFDNHPILNIEDHDVKFLVYPTSTGKAGPIYDSKNYVFNKDGPSSGEVPAASTPGFEFLVLIFAISFFAVFKKKIKK